MRTSRFNWQISLGFLLSLFTFISYPLIFVRWPLTRDFAWANLLLLIFAAVLLFLGLRRSFEIGRRWPSKAAGVVLATFGTISLALFIFIAFVMATWLPASAGAPEVGGIAPDFVLVDQSGAKVSLTQLLTEPLPSFQHPPTHPKSVLLVFYRGYW